MKIVGFALIASLSLAGSALADPAPYSATLAKPLDAPKEIIVSDTIFKCADTSCVTTSRPEGLNSISVCHSLARKVGAMTAYGSAEKPFDADKLAACNAAD